MSRLPCSAAPLVFALLASLMLACPALVLAEPEAPSSEKLPDYQKQVVPLLRKYCVRCHGPETQEARIRLDNLSTDLVNQRAAAETWHEVLNVLNADEMPPEGELELVGTERETLTRWVSGSIRSAVEAQRKTQGRVVIRRLNRTEYQNTMFDLLGLDMDYARDLPPDSVSDDGFRNNGQSLQMSSLQLEYYLDTARRALDRVIVSGPAPRRYDYEFSESNLKNWLKGTERSNRLGRLQDFLATMVDEYPEEGEFLVRVKFDAEIKPDTGFPILEVSVGYRPDTKILLREAGVVEITSAEEQVMEFRGRLENHPLPVRGQGKFPGLVVRIRNIYDDGSPLPQLTNNKKKNNNNNKDKKNDDKKNQGKNGKQEEPEPEPDAHLPKINIKHVEFHGPVYDQWPPAMHRQILFDSDLRETDEAAYMAEVLRRFMQRAYRRPVAEDEVAGMLEFFQSVRAEFPTFEEAVRETLAMVLIRPDFLYLIEPAGEEKREIGDWELASRLSYFLWSTMPDEELMQLAAADRLHEPDVLSKQVERMLADSRSERFVDQFTEQWLHLDVVDRVAVSKDYYPKFDESLKKQMRLESQQFFAELLEHDASALNLLQSDFTMLNEPLARHYGIPGVYGQAFRKVTLPATEHRGGLLGQASVLLANSTGEDSHAVRRAVWIRDRLLNDPPAPPPPNVPTLDEADPKFLKLTIRDQLKIHRESPACGSCHKAIDPWGIALENFDAVGLWRDQVRRREGNRFTEQPVNNKDVLPDGQEIAGVEALKDYLMTERKDEFAEALVTRLLTYALGRRLELSDGETVQKLSADFAEHDYRLRYLVQAIAASRPFQTK